MADPRRLSSGWAGEAASQRRQVAVGLTAPGREFVDRATRLLEDARTLLVGEGESRDPDARTLRIGVCPASLEWLLTAPLATLLRQHPTLRFEVVAATFERVVQLLRHGALDVAFGFEDAFAEWAEIRRETVATLRAVLFARQGHPLLAEPLGSQGGRQRVGSQVAEGVAGLARLVRGQRDGVAVLPAERLDPARASVREVVVPPVAE